MQRNKKPATISHNLCFSSHILVCVGDRIVTIFYFFVSEQILWQLMWGVCAGDRTPHLVYLEVTFHSLWNNGAMVKFIPQQFLLPRVSPHGVRSHPGLCFPEWNASFCGIRCFYDIRLFFLPVFGCGAVVWCHLNWSRLASTEFQLDLIQLEHAGALFCWLFLSVFQ